MDNKFGFLFESPHGWGSVWQRPHHLVSRIARRYECHYFFTQYLKNIFMNYREAMHQRTAHNLPENLSVHNVTLINGERFPPVLKFNRSTLSSQMNKVSSDLKAEKKVLWIYNPHNSFLIDTVPHDILVYDIMDEYSGFPWSPPDIVAEEIKLLERADCVFAGTRALYDSKKKYAPDKIQCYLSGVECEHFGKAMAPDTHIPEDLLEIKKKARLVLGYTGMVDMRIDQETIRQTALNNPDAHFVLIGPKVGDFSMIEGIANVHLSGQRPYSMLPDYIKGFDICIIPFVLNKLTLHINPTKILEYFAAGKYVVTAKIPDVVKYYSDYVGFTEDAESFNRQIEYFTRNKTEVEQKVRAAFEISKQHSWDSRLKSMFSNLGIEI